MMSKINNKSGVEEFWKDILVGKPILSEKEATDISECTRKLRMELGFREIH